MSAPPGPLVMVYVSLPNHWAAEGEVMWALQMGNDLYQLQMAPRHAYGLNCFDVVRAVADDPELPPRVTAVVRRSGHETLRLLFFETVPQPERAALLDRFAQHDANYEAADARYFVIDVEPGGDSAAVRRQLDEWHAAGMIEYETCQARQEGSFDDVAIEES